MTGDFSFLAGVAGAIALVFSGLFNSGLAAAYYLRLAAVAAQRPLDDARIVAPKSRVGPAVIAAVFLAAAATLVLGILPGATLNAAQSAAHTLQAPPAPAVGDPVAASH